jgi:hypothetical protein
MQHALRVVRAHGLPEAAERDVATALRASSSGPLEFAYQAGADARLERGELLDRCAAVFFCFAAANLADDLADGDARYLPPRAAPGAQFILHSLCFETLLGTSVGRRVVQDVATQLVMGGAQQQREVRTRAWTFPVSRDVAVGVAGRQYAAYLRILWAGSPLARRARRVGMDLGIAAHVAADVASGDPRVTTLSSRDRERLLAWAGEAMARLERVDLDCIRAVLKGLSPTTGARAQTR